MTWFDYALPVVVIGVLIIALGPLPGWLVKLEARRERRGFDEQEHIEWAQSLKNMD